MENVTLDLVYKQLLKIEKKLDKVEDILQIPEEEVPEQELKRHFETVQRMKEGKEGVSWDEFKKKAGWQ